MANDDRDYKKVFMALQENFKKYVSDYQGLPLKELLNDNLVVYNYKVRNAVLKEEENYKRCKKLLKLLQKCKDLETLDPTIFIEEVKNLFKLHTADNKDANAYIPTDDPFQITEKLNEINDDQYMEIKSVKNDMNILRKLPEYHFKEIIIHLNLTPSNSHIHVYKKFDSQQMTDTQKQPSSGIFQNGNIISESKTIGSIPLNSKNIFFNNSVSDKSNK